jgi:GTPase
MMSYHSGFVSVIGRPNVGKSTLVNYYVGEKVAIVSAMAQTTRHKILGIVNQPDTQIVFVDTPGIHKPAHALGKVMVRTATATLDEADVVLAMIDGRRGILPEDRRVFDMLARHQGPTLLALNKVDLAKPKGRLLPVIADAEQCKLFDHIIPVSAHTGQQMDVLLREIVAALPVGQPWYEASDVTNRPVVFQLAEVIREHIIHETFQEVPHAVSVQIERMEDEKDGTRHIYATILVERPSHKSILIGKGGQKLKAIGMAARAEMEPMLDRHIYLELWVKVVEHWRENPRQLRDLGYTDA